MTPKTKG